MDDDDERESSRGDRFRRERSLDDNRKREREGSPSDNRGRKKEKYDDFGRISRDNVSESPPRERDSRRERERDRDRRTDSYRPDRDFDRKRDRSPRRMRERDYSPINRRERDYSPSVKRRRRDDDRGFYDNRDRYTPDRRRRSRERSRERKPKADLFEGPLKSIKQFLDAVDDRYSTSEGEKKYEEYKLEFKKRHSRNFFNEHKEDVWFKEKYDPASIEMKRLAKMELAKERVKEFVEELEAGKLGSLDAVDLQEEAPTEPVVSEDDKAPEPTEEKSEESKEESADTEDKGQERKMIKLKPANPRKNEKLDLPLSSENEPDVELNMLFIKTIPPNQSRASLVDAFKETDGYRAVTLSEPMRAKNFHRIGWVAYDTKEHALKALSELNGKKLGEFELLLALNKQPPSDLYQKVKITPPVASEPERIQHDLEVAKKLAVQLDKEKEIQDNVLFTGKFSEQELTTVEELDRVIHYLRKVHCYCYYCGEEYDDEEELKRKAGQKHLRGRKKDSSVTIDVSTDSWANSLDQKNKARAEDPPNPNVANGQALIEKKISRFHERNTIKLEEEKYRCAICNKLFMGDKFVQKHLNLKHVELVEEAKKKALEKQFFRNYVNDPKRILPAMVATTPSNTGYSMGRGGVSSPMRGRYGGWPMTPVLDPYNRGLMPAFFPSPFFSPIVNERSRGSMRGRTPRQQRFQPVLMPSLDLDNLPPSAELDPRAAFIRGYEDLDAPTEEIPQIDYRMSVPTGSKSEQESPKE